MRVHRLHGFSLSPREAIALQKELAVRVSTSGPAPRPLRRVLGVDCAPSRNGTLHAAAVLCAAPDWRVIEASTASGPPPMPYVSGLLSFRETPLVLEALEGINAEPDAILVDGQGIAHPRRFGLGAHLGLHVDAPVVGIGKTRLCGTHEEPGRERGASVPLTDGGRTIGCVLRTRTDVKPVYVSVGNRISLRGAVAIALATGGGYRLPEPVRQADLLSKRVARGG